MKVLALAIAAPVLLAFTPPAVGPVETHFTAMQGASQFTVTFTVTEIGGNQEEQTLMLGKPGFLKWETPTTLTLVDGKMTTVYNKSKKTYTQTPVSTDWPKALFADDAIWAWSAFFDANFAKQVTSSRAGNGRTVRGVQMSEASLSREKGPITVFFDKKTGIARGATYKTARGADVVVQVSAMEALKTDFDVKVFAFTPPAGATLAAAPDPTRKLVFADVQNALERNCGSCHIRESRGRVSLASGAAAKQSGVIGDTANNSRMIQAIRSGKMPPRGRVSQADMDLLVKWIDDGAND
ncbi:MAG: hypothetical protein JNJ45_11420 [Chthonomonas sp.]|nr:hypothetical protein [Chthonomonas sp.]